MNNPYDVYLQNFRKIVDLAMEAPKDPQKCECPEEERVLLSRGSAGRVYVCLACGRHKTLDPDSEGKRS